MYKITITDLEEIKKALLIANKELLKDKKHLKGTYILVEAVFSKLIIY